MNFRKIGAVLTLIIVILGYSVMHSESNDKKIIYNTKIPINGLDNSTINMNVTYITTEASTLPNRLSILFRDFDLNDKSLRIGVSSYITNDGTYTYMFFPFKNRLWGIKIDGEGNIIWSFYYDLTGTQTVGYIRHLTGSTDSQNIYLVFEDDGGNDYSIVIRKSDGHIISSKIMRDNTYDVFTLNSDGYYRQYYSKIFSPDFSTFKIIGGSYPYTIPSTHFDEYIIFDIESMYTNGGYDYIVYYLDNRKASITNSYFFGSKGNDYIYGKFDTFTLWGKTPRPGFLIDNNYAYVFINDFASGSYSLRFALVKLSRNDGNYIWVTSYVLPKIGNYNKIELLNIYDDGDYIIVKGRLTTSTGIINGAYFIMKISKSDGSVPNYKNDPNRHGFIVIMDNNGDGLPLDVLFKNGYIYMITSDDYNGKRIVRYIQSPVSSVLLYNITVDYVNVLSGSGTDNDLKYFRIFT